MIPNSRPATKDIAVTAEVLPSTRVANSYSDTLMDDLFLDVDKILEGDLSSYMTVVNHTPKPIKPSSRTVQLPSNFAPRSAADIYRATLAASQSPAATSPVLASSVSNAPVHGARTGYRKGGRPVTASSRTALQAGPQSAKLSGKNQSTLIHPASGASSQDLYGTPPVQPVSNFLYPNPPLSEITLSGASARPPQTIFEPQRKQQSVSLPFLLMGAAGISAVSTLGLWTASHSAPRAAWLLPLGREASAAELPAQSDEDFLVYLQQSLDVISARVDNSDQMTAVIPAALATPPLPTTVPNTNPAPQLGALPNLPGTATAPNAQTASQPNVIERVFVPVYGNGQANPQQTASQPSAPLPNVAVPGRSAQRPTVPVPAPVAAAAALPPGAPIAASESLPVLSAATGDLPSPGVPIAVTNTNSGATGIVDSTPAVEYALVGVLNLGSRSAALIDIDGTSQRAYVGDRIGVSDWTLVSVNGQDVVIRRDGEVRSIYIGQRF